MDSEKQKEIQLMTNKKVNGRWRKVIGDVEYKLNISSHESTLQILDKNVQKELIKFSDNAHWFGPWLLFINSPKQFYASYADDKNLNYGEYEGATFGNNIKWEHTFERVN